MKKGGLEIPAATTVQRATKLSAPKVIQTPAPAVNERGIAEPTMITAWDNIKISLACSQIATGTSTTTFFTSTATAYSGTVTSTVFSITDVLGKNRDINVRRNSGLCYRNKNNVFRSSHCHSDDRIQLSPPITSLLLHLHGHGAPHIDGKQLYMQDDYASPIFGGWGNEYSLATFYLTCAGDLVVLPYM
jgi:hypothetical protein